MKQQELEAERAELIQSVKALLIPASLFLACIVMAAGIFLLYNHEALGYAFVVVSIAVIACAFTAFIRFQNKYRAKGILPPEQSYDK